MVERIIQVKRIYDLPSEDDGFRILVDRLWPRGVKREDARIDLWAKQVAPTSELRKWFGHDPKKFDEFKTRYVEELQANSASVSSIFDSTKEQPITLLYAARDPTCNHAIVLRSFLLDV